MDPRDTPYKSNILEINEIDFDWVKKTDDKKLLKEAVKLLQNESNDLIRLPRSQAGSR